MATPPESSFRAGDRVVLHGLSTAVLNGALGLVETPSADVASRGRVAVRVSCPAAAAAAHPVAALKAANLRRCDADELARLYGRELWQHLQDELRAASLDLQAAAEDDVSSGPASREPPALARLRSVMAQADEALTYLDEPKNPLPVSTEASARDGLIALYAFLLATASTNVATVCAMRGDSRGQLAAYERAFARSLQRRMLPVVAAQYGQPGLVQEACLRYGEALRVAGRPHDAVPPLRLAARVAAAEEDDGTEAAAQGTLCCVLLGLSDLGPADAAGEREVALLSAAEEEGQSASPVALARARAGLGNVKHARAAAAGAGTPEADAFAAQAAELAAAALAAVPPRCRAAEAPHWAEVACGALTLRGHLERLRGDLRAAAAQYDAALEAATRGVGAPPGAGAPRPLPSDAAVAPHALLERVHAELAAQARAEGAASADDARAHGAEAVRHRRALFDLLGKPLPTECSICADALQADDAVADVAMLPCMHAFHARCIDAWLRQKQLPGTCPLCRAWSVAAERDDVEACRETVEALHQSGANVTLHAA